MIEGADRPPLHHRQEESYMPIQVIFDKNWFYHDAYGRMGRGKMAGRVYTLDDAFAAPGMLPSTAEIISDPDVLEEALEDAGQTKPYKAVVASEEALKKAKANRGISDTKRPDPAVRARDAGQIRRRKVT
jgi:hypothetical protein